MSVQRRTVLERVGVEWSPVRSLRDVDPDHVFRDVDLVEADAFQSLGPNRAGRLGQPRGPWSGMSSRT